MHTIASWLRLVRVPTLTASVIPVALGGLLAHRAQSLNLTGTVLAAVAMACFQVAANLTNDVHDFNKKVDTKQSLGSTRVIVDGLLEEKQVLTAARAVFGAGVLIGLYLSAVGGIVIFALGMLGAAGAYFYTGKPFSFKYKGWGVPLVFMMFGPLPVFGAYYLSARAFDPAPVLLSLPVGFLTTAILHVNDLRDIEHDKRAGIKSLAMGLGRQNARVFYLLLISASFFSVALYVVLGLLTAWSLLVFGSLPLAVILIRSLSSHDKLRAIDHKTAVLQMAFGLLLLVSILL